MTHEAPRPFFVGSAAGRRGIDAGKTPINEVLTAMQPAAAPVRSPSRFTDQERQGVTFDSGLDLVSPLATCCIDDERTLDVGTVRRRVREGRSTESCTSRLFSETL